MQQGPFSCAVEEILKVLVCGGSNSEILLSPHLETGVGECLRKRWGNEIQQRQFSRQFSVITAAWLWACFTSLVFLPNSKHQHSESQAGFSHGRSALLTDLLIKWSLVSKKSFTKL